MPDPIVQVSGLNFSFGSGELQRQILFDIKLEIYPGEIVILEGPSGSGKTTLLTLISGLRTFHQGSIRLFGSEICGQVSMSWSCSDVASATFFSTIICSSS